MDLDWLPFKLAEGILMESFADTSFDKTLCRIFRHSFDRGGHVTKRRTTFVQFFFGQDLHQRFGYSCGK